MPSQLSICTLLRSESLEQSLQQFLSSDRYVLTHMESEVELLHLDGWHKRNTKQFFEQMTDARKQAFLQQIKADYSQILINYFTADKTIKQRIDNFINTAFSSNIPVPQIIEIHMELIDDFSKKLKLEGRSDEVLLDYRLTLIDILAHLCEAYRCSVPKQF